MADQRYSCNFSGQCETDPNGRFPNEPACTQACYARPQRELNYLVQSFAAQHDALAPSDAAEVVRRITGIRPQRTDASDILRDIEQENVLTFGGLVDRHPEYAQWAMSDPVRVLAARVSMLSFYTDPQNNGEAAVLDNGDDAFGSTALHETLFGPFEGNLEPVAKVIYWLDRAVGKSTVSFYDVIAARVIKMSIPNMTYSDLVGMARGVIRYYGVVAYPRRGVDMAIEHAV